MLAIMPNWEHAFAGIDMVLDGSEVVFVPHANSIRFEVMYRPMISRGAVVRHL